MSDLRWRMKGGARLDANGNFELYLKSQDGNKCVCMSQEWKQYIRELFDFLMSDNPGPKQIGDREVYKAQFSTGSWTVSVDFNKTTIQLIRGRGEFATFVLRLPFIGDPEVTEDMVGVHNDDDVEDDSDVP